MRCSRRWQRGWWEPISERIEKSRKVKGEGFFLDSLDARDGNWSEARQSQPVEGPPENTSGMRA
jgi:hypothetical protein